MCDRAHALVDRRWSPYRRNGVLPAHYDSTEKMMAEARWNQVVGLIAEQSTQEQVSTLLGALLSHDEKLAVGGRLAVFKALLEGRISQRQIAADLGVSIATITRASNTLKSMDEDARLTLRQMLQLS
ncbi:trp operon repressor [Ferrimonas marina]|nr:trp operon repressor [Ferrimonas marina]